MNEMTIRNPDAIVEFENQNNRGRSVGLEMVATREAQEVQTAMIIAKRFPRDTLVAYNNIMTDCSRQTLAEKAIYEYPKGGTTVRGPSIHLARALARGWGNLKSGFKVLEETGTSSVVMAYCHDLETNYYEEKIFTVKHFRHTKKGDYPITDPREIYENIANQAARRERSCILSVIPADVVDAAVGQCTATLQKKGGMPLVDRVRILVKNFQEQYSVTPEMLEAFIGCKKEAFSEQSVIRLKGVYNAIRDGSAGVEQYFGEQKPQDKPREALPEPAGTELAQAPTGELRLDDILG